MTLLTGSTEGSKLDALLKAVKGVYNELQTNDKDQEAKIKSLEGQYQALVGKSDLLSASLAALHRRISHPKVLCHDKLTPWAPYSAASIMYLDRQHVTCPPSHFISSFRLVRQADRKKAPVRYTYKCCKLVL